MDFGMILVEWMCYRFYEIYQEQGFYFNLVLIVVSFYYDFKYVQVWVKNGIVSVGCLYKLVIKFKIQIFGQEDNGLKFMLRVLKWKELYVMFKVVLVLFKQEDVEFEFELQ